MMRRLLMCVFALVLSAQELTTRIVDTLYAQDGQLFSGTVQVQAMRLESGDRTVIPKPMTIKVSAGRLDIRLAPNAGSRPDGTSYRATYLPDGGKGSWTEYWVVPASSVPVTVKQIWVAVMPSPNATIDISQVGGLLGALDGKSPVLHGHDSLYVRLDGAYVDPNWLAGLDWSRLLNTPGSFPAAPHAHPLGGDLSGTTDAGNVLRVQGRDYDATAPVDGQVYAWDSLASRMTPKSFNGAYADGEVPAGTLDGVNSTFTLLSIPVPAGSLQIYRNGLLQKRGIGGDYEIAGNTITFYPASIPQSGEMLQASYRWAPALPFGSQVLSVFGRAGNVELQEGDVSTSQVVEGLRLYFTEARVRAALSATGPIQFDAVTGTFACPTCVTEQYTLPVAAAGTLGGVKIGANLTIGPDGTLSAPAAGRSYAFQPPLAETEGVVSLNQGALSIGWNQVSNPPATYAPAPHGHSSGDLPGTGGDLSGPLDAAQVVAIRGRAVDGTAPADGQFYHWNASNSKFELVKLKHVVDFVNATSLTVTAAEHGLLGTAFKATCYDNASPRRLVEGNDVLIDDTTRAISITWAVAWSGRCVFQ